MLFCFLVHFPWSKYTNWERVSIWLFAWGTVNDLFRFIQGVVINDSHMVAIFPIRSVNMCKTIIFSFDNVSFLQNTHITVTSQLGCQGEIWAIIYEFSLTYNFNGLVKAWNYSSVFAMELLQYCTKPLIYHCHCYTVYMAISVCYGDPTTCNKTTQLFCLYIALFLLNVKFETVRILWQAPKCALDILPTD